MRSIQEAKKQLQENAHKTQTEDMARVYLWKRYLQKVKEMDIPAYYPTVTNASGELVDKTDYRTFRDRLRDRIDKIEHATVGFLELTCDECGTVLFDAMVGACNMSHPPSFWADCIGCGKRHVADLNLRSYCTDYEIAIRI